MIGDILFSIVFIRLFLLVTQCMKCQDYEHVLGGGGYIFDVLKEMNPRRLYWCPSDGRSEAGCVREISKMINLEK